MLDKILLSSVAVFDIMRSINQLLFIIYFNIGNNNDLISVEGLGT